MTTFDYITTDIILCISNSVFYSIDGLRMIELLN